MITTLRNTIFVLVFSTGTAGLGHRAHSDASPAVQDEVQDEAAADNAAQGDAKTADESAVAKGKESPATLKERLFKSMDEIIPGEFDEASTRYSQIQEVVNLFSENKADEAMKILEEIEKQDDKFPPTSLLMAGLFFSVGNGQPAMSLLEKTALDNPDYPSTYVGFARVAIKSRRWTDANALLEKVERLVQGGTWSEDQKKQFQLELLDGKVDVAMGQRRFEDARTSLIELAEVIPDSVRVPLRFAEAEFELGNIDASQQQLEKARELESNVLWPELVLFNWYTRKNNLEAARKWIDKAAIEHPDDSTIQLSFARHLLQAGDNSEAKIWAKKAEDSGADNYATTYLKGQIAFAERSYVMSEHFFGELSKSRPGDFGVANMYALCLAENDDPLKQQQALQLATNTAKLNPRNLEALSTLGWIYFLRGEHQTADQILGQVARSGNLKPEAAFYIAHLWEAKEQNENAEKLLEKCVASKGFFLFRNRADEMRRKIKTNLEDKSKKSSEPEPSDGDGDKKKDDLTDDG